MYPIPPSETLIETKNCKHCSASFPITDKDMEFYDKVSPTFGGQKYQIPPPTLCPDCRQQRRLSFRNERKLYKRKCDATGKEIVSIYSPDKSYTVYHQDYWWSDVWDPMSYGRNFDFSRSVFKQFGELYREFPKVNLWIRKDMENCDYCNFGSNSSNCYMTTAPHHSENSFNTNTPVYCKSDIDGYFNLQGDHLYECLNTTQCTNLDYSKHCQLCKNSSYLTDCVDCEYCYGCIGLYHKKYFILNQEYSSKEYGKIINSIIKNKKKRSKYIKDYRDLQNGFLYISARNLKVEDSYGDGLTNVKNSCFVFDCMGLEDSKYCTISGGNSKCLYDSINGGLNSEYCLETLSTITITSCHFCMLTYFSRDVYYSFHIESSQNLFLCTGLRNKSYCILNKQYTKEEYEELVPKIIDKMMADGEWGEFFPSSMSPFGYNETVAQEYFPLMREEITESEFFNWSDYAVPFPTVEKVIPASKLPDTIEGIPDDVLNWAIECEVSGKPFRIIRQELEFYRRHSIPIPRRHPDIRHADRMKLRNPRKLFERKCDKCGVDMITTYAPERPETVYCSSCYDREVIG